VLNAVATAEYPVTSLILDDKHSNRLDSSIFALVELTSFAFDFIQQYDAGSDVPRGVRILPHMIRVAKKLEILEIYGNGLPNTAIWDSFTTALIPANSLAHLFVLRLGGIRLSSFDVLNNALSSCCSSLEYLMLFGTTTSSQPRDVSQFEYLLQFVKEKLPRLENFHSCTMILDCPAGELDLCETKPNKPGEFFPIQIQARGKETIDRRIDQTLSTGLYL
jgi:hypothetical protein